MRAALAILLLLAGCGDDAAERAFRETVAALQKGELRKAESAAAKAAAGDFLMGNVKFAKCELAERQAEQPGAEPFAFDIAINYAQSAHEAWQRAALSRDDWPAARRNVERALLKIEELKKKRDEKQQDRKKKPTPQPKPQPQKNPVKQPQPKPAPDKPQRKELSPEEVLRLLDRLAQKEKDKLALRRTEKKKRSAGVERDW